MIFKYWLPIAAAAFLVGMMLYGHYRGFLRQCVSLGALLLTILVVRGATPYITSYVRENLALRQRVTEMVLDAAGWSEPEQEEATEIPPAAQRMTIEAMQLPQVVKDVLLENNNNEIYQMLGVGHFAEYVGTYLADMVINAVSSACLFLLCSVLVHIVIRWLGLITRLPIISGLNQIAGAVLGLIHGLLLLWIAGFIVSIFSSTPTGQMLEEQIYASRWLTFIYQYNLIKMLLFGIIKGIF